MSSTKASKSTKSGYKSGSIVPLVIQSQAHHLFSTFADELHDQTWLDVEIPKQLEHLVTVIMAANPETLKFFRQNNLSSAKEIAAFGNQDLYTLLNLFPISQIINPYLICTI